MKTSRRFDRGELTVIERGDGFLRCRVAIARVGVFPYVRSDGKVVMEAKLPDDLFSEFTIQSAKGAPITDEHPPASDSKGFVTPENYSKYVRGALGDSIVPENDLLFGHETVYDSELIDQILSEEKVEVSIGFDTLVEHTPGMFNGVRYDAVQRKIKINHLAHTVAGRAGETVRAYFDSAPDDDFAVQADTTTRNDGGKEEMNKMKMLEALGRIKAGVSTRKDSEATPGADVENTLKDINSMIEELSKTEAPTDEGTAKELADKIATMQSQIDTLNALVAEKSKLLEQATSPETLDSLVTERSALIGAVKSVDPEFKTDSISNRKLKLALIEKVLPYGAGVRVDSLSDSTINDRYDAAAELAREKAALRHDSSNISSPRIDAAEIEKKKNARLTMHEGGSR